MMNFNQIICNTYRQTVFLDEKALSSHPNGLLYLTNNKVFKYIFISIILNKSHHLFKDSLNTQYME